MTDRRLCRLCHATPTIHKIWGSYQLTCCHFVGGPHDDLELAVDEWNVYQHALEVFESVRDHLVAEVE